VSDDVHRLNTLGLPKSAPRTRAGSIGPSDFSRRGRFFILGNGSPTFDRRIAVFGLDADERS